jgi:molecular chaperone GrpE
MTPPPNPNENEEQTQESPEEQPAAFDLTPDGDEPTLEGEGPDLAVQDQFEALQQERDELEQKLLRTAADYQNFVKRSENNLASTRQQAIAGVVRSLVSVLDNLDRAADVDADKTSALDVLRGVDTIRTELLQAMENFGLRKLEVQPGDEFDPNIHEALMRQPTEDVESGQIAAQFQPGYLLNDIAIRPAQVSVAE